ncbi:MAG: hypothetical protein ACYCZW_01215 [Minisyncoccota bacterium]
MQKTQKTNKYCVDTSCHYEKIKGNVSWIDRLRGKKGNSMYSLYCILYEYKSGIIHDWIQFYFLVEIDGYKKAHSDWSNRYGRKNNNITILNGIAIEELESSGLVVSEKSYLKSIEVVIHRAMVIFHLGLDGLVGSFANNNVVKQKIFSREDYEDFIILLKNTDEKFIKLGEFSKIHTTSLTNIHASFEKANTHDDLRKVIKEVLDDSERGNMHNNSRKLGDVVIALDTPKKYTLISKDNFHQEVSDIIGLKFLDYKTL